MQILTEQAGPLVLGLMLLASSAWGAPQEDRDIFDIWTMDRGNTNPAALKRASPWIKGAFVRLKWDHLEPAKGHFDGSYFDDPVIEHART